MKTKQKKSLEDLVKDWARENIVPEVEKLKACTMLTEIEEKYPLREGCKPGKSNTCVVVYISDEEGGEFLYDLFKNKTDPPGVPIGQYVAELVEDGGWGDRDSESEEMRLSCIEEIRASLLELEASIKERMIED